MPIGTVANSIIPVGYTNGYAGNAKLAFWQSPLIDVSAVADGDIIKMGYMPAQSLMLKVEYWTTTDFDTGTETLDMDLGWAAAGNSTDQWTDPVTGKVYTNASASASPAGILNAGVWTGDAVSGTAAIEYRTVLFTDPLYFSAKTLIQFEANAAVNAAGTDGYINMFVTYHDV
jgi:hypothetical protein